MKNMNRIAAILISSIAMITAACGNAEAKRDGKNKAQSETQVTKAIEITAEQFNKLVYDMTKKDSPYLGDKPAIVDFTAKWCGPCQRISPILDQLAAEYKDQIVIYKVDIDKNQELAREFGVKSIPAILYIPAEGDPSMTVGARDKTRFKNEIDTYLLGK